MKKYLFAVIAVIPLSLYQPPNLISDADLHCLALNAYHEARGESLKGIYLVTKSVINRYKQGKYDSICATITAPKQYSWTNDIKKLKPANYQYLIPYVQKGIYYPSTVTHYHTKKVKPVWRTKLKQIQTVDNHIYYTCTKTC